MIALDYGEITSIIEDAVKIGAKVAIYGISADLENLDKSDFEGQNEKNIENC